MLPYPELYIDAGFASADEVRAAGIDIGTPIVYAPRVDRARRRPDRRHLGRRPRRLRGDARGGARALQGVNERPTVHLVFSVQEEFNLRGALPAAQALAARHRHPARPDPRHRHAGHDGARRRDARRRAGDEHLFLPRPRHAERHHPASGAGGAVRGDGEGGHSMPLQRSAHIGALTDNSYVQLVGAGRRGDRSRLPAAATRIPRSRSATSAISRR